MTTRVSDPLELIEIKKLQEKLQEAEELVKYHHKNFKISKFKNGSYPDRHAELYAQSIRKRDQLSAILATLQSARE